MILAQDLRQEGDKTILRNTIDVTPAIEKAMEYTETQARGKNLVPLGFIPPEMWNFDPWLMEAKRAQGAGDMHEYQKYVLKFFRLHPKYAVWRGRKYWSGA